MKGSFFSSFRSHSRPSSPAPSMSQTDPAALANNDVVDHLSLPPLALTTSGTSTPPFAPPTHRSRPMSRLSLTPFRRASPSPAPAALPFSPSLPASLGNTPVASPSASPALHPSTHAAGGPGSSYLDNLGLRLGEATQKALILPASGTSHSGLGSSKSTSLGSKASNGLGLIHHGTAGRALEDTVLRGKKPLPAGRGRALGSLIASELYNASHNLHDPYLHRAIVRLLQRPLTLLLTNLSQSVTTLILSPEFEPTVPLMALNPTQIHAVAYAGFASELLETFDAMNLGRSNGQLHNDGLKVVKEGLENVITKVVGPLLAIIKAELVGIVDDLEAAGQGTVVSGGDIGTLVDKLEKTLNRVGTLVGLITFTPPVDYHLLQAPVDAAMPAPQSTFVQSMLATFEIAMIWKCLVALATRRLTGLAEDAVASPTPLKPKSSTDALLKFGSAPLKNQASEGSLSVSSASSSSAGGSFAIPPYVTPPTTPHLSPLLGVVSHPSPGKGEVRELKRSSLGMSLSLGLGNKSSSKLSAMAGSTSGTNASTKLPTPPGTTKFGLAKLPSLKPLSRAPSPVHEMSPGLPSPPRRNGHLSPSSSPPPPPPNPASVATQLLAHDARLISSALKRLPRPCAPGLAREAVEEAIDKMDGLIAVLEFVKGDSGLVPASVSMVEGKSVDVGELMEKTRMAPMLLVLPILMRVWASTSTAHHHHHRPDAPPSSLTPADVQNDSVASWIGLSEVEYRRSCLGGFGKAEECAAIVGRAVLGCRTMREVLKAKDVAHPIQGQLPLIAHHAPVQPSSPLASQHAGVWFREWVEKTVEELDEDDESDDDEEAGVLRSVEG